MAKRFIDTNIFRKEFIRGLDAPYKLLWLYIINECDHAGLWDVEIDVAKARLGVDINEATALTCFKDKIKVVKGKWFIQDFIDFQYGELKAENRAHNSVIQILNKYGLIENKPLTSPLQGAMDMDKDKDKEKDKDKDKTYAPDFEIYPITHRQSLRDWWEYKIEKKQRYKPKGWEAFIETSLKMDAVKFNNAVKRSMANNWQGLHAENDKPKFVPPNTASMEGDEYMKND